MAYPPQKEGSPEIRKKAIRDISSFVEDGGRAVFFVTSRVPGYYLSKEISNNFGVTPKYLGRQRLPSAQISGSIFSDEKVKFGCSTAWHVGEDKASNRVTCSGAEAYLDIKDGQNLISSDSTFKSKNERVPFYAKKKHGKGEIVIASIFQTDSGGSNLFFNDKNYEKEGNPEAAKNMIKWLISENGSMSD